MSASKARIVITGMSINTPLSDTTDGHLAALLAGKSACSNWKTIDTKRIYSKVGADLSTYDWKTKFASLEGLVPPDVYKRARKIIKTAPWSTKLTVLLALEGWRDAKLYDSGIDMTRATCILAGHNINQNYQYEQRIQFNEEPDFMDNMLALSGLDTDHAGCVSEVIGIKGPSYTMGAACASANHALRATIDEIRHHDAEVGFVVGAVLDFSPIELHAMCLMGAITYQSFNDEPEKASRPYDTRREGFVPAHGGATLVVESLEHAQKRGAHIYAEVLAVDANSDANHLPNPSEEGQSRLMAKVLGMAGLEPEHIDYVNAHATSTPLGDLTELRSIKRVFGKHAYKMKVNATKSMLGHTCWAAPAVESVGAIMQMNANMLHPSINIDIMDPEVDIDVCANKAVPWNIRHVMKNSFGFGGVNCVSILKKWEGK